jgi:hypothetical protein
MVAGVVDIPRQRHIRGNHLRAGRQVGVLVGVSDRGGDVVTPAEGFLDGCSARASSGAEDQDWDELLDAREA